MKRLLLIPLILIYSISIFGMNVKSFYCCGILKSVSITFKSEQKKSEQKTSFGKDCCKTTYQTFQVKDNHLASTDVNIPAKQFVQIVFIPNLYFSPDVILHEVTYNYQSHAPPLHKHAPLYISNCIFRI